MVMRSRIVAGVAALLLAGGVAVAAVAAVAAPAANAATVACGSGCMALAAQSWGLNYVSSNPGSATAGQDVILARAAEFSAEDFKLQDLGTVAPFYAAGIVGPAVGQTWPSDEVYEYLYAPNGVWTTLCLGVAVTAANGTAVSLQPCGTTARTLWIALAADRIGSYQPLINGTDTVISTPDVLTAGQVGGILTTTELSLAAGSIAPSQMWQNRSGVYYPYRLGG
jgi:hypothetical protein